MTAKKKEIVSETIQFMGHSTMEEKSRVWCLGDACQDEGEQSIRVRKAQV